MAHPSVLAAFLRYTESFESFVRYMYLDLEGYVTTGYGNKIDPVVSPLLDWRRRADNAPASHAEVTAEFLRVRGLQAIRRAGGGAFALGARLFATGESIHLLALAELDGFDAALAGAFPEYPAWPSDAQLSALSKSWACGEHFEPRWPRLSDALGRGAWLEASRETVPSGAQLARQNASYHRRISTEMLLLENAHVVASQGLPIETLQWPLDLYDA